MIDLHVHILPGTDDGARTLEESLQMCRISYLDGVRTIVATPHSLNGFYVNERDTILSKVKELNEALAQFGVESSEFGEKNSNGLQSAIRHDTAGVGTTAVPARTDRNPRSAMDLRVLPGSDVHLCEKTVSTLDEGKLMTVGDGKKYLFIEFPSQGIPFGTEEVLFQLMKRGILPIVTHPERNQEFWHRPQRYYEMIRLGCLGQVTAMSLTGGFGPKAKETARSMMKHRLIHFIASDAHSTDGRAPILSGGVRAAEKIVGMKEARKMVEEYPRAILEGMKPDVPGPVPF